ncbi:MAG: peptidyl-prolyl cis-trans isomerase [Succinivibrionaceae bacterium]|nr:peptidyl-prolyl cis-trans isomerase [Succinivibrionaceae bacterium]
MITIKTSLGDLKLELYEDKAPETCKNFLTYAKEGFYDGTIFHRVIKRFMVQGGGFTMVDGEMEQKETHDPIKNEAATGVKNQRGTIAMARTNDPHSATCQFFINTVDNAFLDFQAPTVSGFGYCAFGKVTEGLEVLDKIEAVKTHTIPRGFQDVPVEPVTIISVTVDQDQKD